MQIKFLKDVLTEKSDYEISLTKLLGQSIKDILGHASNEFDVPVFEITQIVLEDGKIIWVEGEHDIAYLPSDEKHDGLDEEQLLTLLKESE